MYMIKVTIAATSTAQPIIASAVQPSSSHQVQGIFPQNNGANPMYLGDAAVTKTNSIIVNPTGTLPAFPAIAYAIDLNELWVIGTQNDILNIMVFP
jgi:hypothetical protein